MWGRRRRCRKRVDGVWRRTWWCSSGVMEMVENTDSTVVEDSYWSAGR